MEVECGGSYDLGGLTWIHVVHGPYLTWLWVSLISATLKLNHIDLYQEMIG